MKFHRPLHGFLLIASFMTFGSIDLAPLAFWGRRGLGEFWQAFYATALICQLTLLAVWAVLRPWSWRTAWPIAAIGGLLWLVWLTLGYEACQTCATIAVATAAWPLPARFTGKRLLLMNHEWRAPAAFAQQSLAQWLLTIAVIAASIVVVQNFPGPVRERGYFVSTALASYFGVSIVLSGFPFRARALLFVAMLTMCGFGGLLVAAELSATMNWTAPPVHGELAPIWSPLDFVTTRLAHMRYFELLHSGLVWAVTLCIIETMWLSVLRIAGYRVVDVGKKSGASEPKA